MKETPIVTEWTTNTICDVTRDASSIDTESLKRAMDAIRQRLEAETVGAILGMKVILREWMEPGDYVLVNDKSIVYVKGEEMYTMPFKFPKWPFESEPPKFEVKAPPSRWCSTGGFWW